MRFRSSNKFLAGVAALLVLTNIGTVIWFVSRSSTPADFVKRYPFIDLARNFIPQEHYLSNLQPIREDLRGIIDLEKSNDIEVSLYFEFLNTGGNISINQESRLIPASLNKLPVAMAVMKKIEEGDWKMEDELVLLSPDVNRGFGKLYQMPIGSSFTIEFLLKSVLQQSDNTAFSILYRNLAITEPHRVLEELGLLELFNDEGQITAKEYSRLLRALYTASFLNRDNSQQLLEWLANTDFKDFLSRGVPKEVPFAHKFGLNETNRVFSDSGIVYVPNRPYLMTVLIHPLKKMTTEQDLKDAARIMGEISAKTYKYINEY